MKKLLCIAAGLTALLASVSCNDHTQETSSENSSVQFRENGKLKIAHFTDIHLIWTNQTEYEKTYNQLCYILDSEKPDLAILTGDLIFGDGHARESLDKFFGAFDDRNVPFVAVYGNHDRERDLSEWDLASVIADHPSSLNTIKDGYLDDVALRVMSSDGSKVSAVLYCMDSGDYPSFSGFEGYAWMAHSQVEWYEKMSTAFTAANGNVPVPSYAFFHIPLREFEEAFQNHPLSGVRTENECYGALNSGLFATFVENADVHGVFCGHDHNNDYVSSMKDIALVYGRYSGDQTVYNNLEHGIRIIELTEGDYGFRSWIHERNGAIVYDYTFKVDAGMDEHKAVTAERKEHGVLVTRYDDVDLLAEMEQKASKGQVDTLPYPRIWGNLGTPNYGYTFEGYLDVPESGLWNFEVGVDNEAIVSIGDFTFKDTNGWERVRVNLEKGLHPIKVAVKCYSDNCWVKMMWFGPGEDRFHEIRPKYYYIK